MNKNNGSISQTINDTENERVVLSAINDKKQLIEHWTNPRDKKKSSAVFITGSSIYINRKNLIKLLPELRDKFSTKTNRVGCNYLEDSILILRRDFGETLREIFSLDNSSPIELELKKRGVRKLKNLYLEAEDCVKSAISTENQVSIEDIKDIILNFGEMADGIDKWAHSLSKTKDKDE